MKKKIFITAAVLIGLLFSFYGFLQFRQYSSYRTPIHAEAQNIIKINADALIKDFIKEYGFNFNKKIKKATGRDTTEKINTGIYLPANLFIYQISSLPQSAWFCSIPLYDSADFTIYLKQKFKFTLKDSSGLTKGFSPDEKIHFVSNGKYAAFSYTHTKEDFSTTLTDILLGKKILERENNLLKELKSNQSVLSFFSKQLKGDLNFKGNDLNISAELIALNQNFIPAVQNNILPKDANFLTANLNLNISKGLLKKEYQLKEFTLETDSILKYYKGFAAFQAGEGFISSDTAISYEYDDNFEMKEVKKINKVQVPFLQLVIAAEEGMLSYLKNTSFINADNRFNKNIFPLYPVKVAYQNNLLLFSTEVNKLTPPALQKAADFMKLEVNFAKVDTGFLGNIIAPYIKDMENFIVTGELNKKNIPAVKATLHFKKPAVQALIDLAKRF